MKYPLFRHLNQLATDRWARQGVRRLLRATWIGVCVWCIGLGAHLAWGWPLRLEILGALALAIIGIAVASLLRPKLSPREAARRLDRHFELNEQLATAVEVAAAGPRPGSVAAHLLAQSGQTAGVLRQRIMRRQRAPWSEVLALLAIGLVALGLWIMVGIGRPVLTGTPAPLPPLVNPQDPTQQFAEEPPAQNGQGQVLVPGQEGQAGTTGDPNVATGTTSGDPATLEALADALRDQGATRPAAEALDHGNVGDAAQELRELADQAGQLSQAARNDLANSLRDAADRIEPRNPELAEQLRDSADGLQNGGQAAARALEDLAEAIEQLQESQAANQGQGDQPGQGEQGQQGQGEQGQQGQEGQGQGQGQEGQGQGQGQGSSPGSAGDGSGGEQRPAEPIERMGVEGQPLPLEASGPGQVPAQPSDRPPTASDLTPGFTRGDSSDNQRVQSGADPLRVPLDERDIVQDYFAP